MRAYGRASAWTVWMLLIALQTSIAGAVRQTQPIIASEMRSVTLRLQAEGANSVCVAGVFNHWSRDAAPMLRQTDGQTWTLTLSLSPGIYPFKFVIDGTKWVTDPTRPHADDGNGNINSLLVVPPRDYDTMPGHIGDGRITGSAVQHTPTAQYIHRIDRDRLQVMLRTRHDDVAHCDVELLSPLAPRDTMRQAQLSLIPMRRADTNALYDTWQATLPISSVTTLHYAFVLQDGAGPHLYDLRGLLPAGNRAEPRGFMLRAQDFPPFVTPDWARDAVFYQIFPDRFADGDPGNDGPDAQPFGSKPDFFSRQGGDLTGVQQHLDYLKALGISALYFNPLFTARSNHGYDTTDYLHIDPHFGDDAQLATLVQRAHDLGWHVILDGVFNHTGVDFFAFRSLREAGESSPYRDWYFINGFPIEVKENQTHYTGWYGSPWMPKLNVDNPPTRAYLLDVATRWIAQAHIDGWRLDAADEVDPGYWRAFRKAVRKADPDAYLVGEIWTNARDWLQGDEFDSVMNYRWRGAVLDFFVFDKTSPAQFDGALAQIRSDYPPAATAVMFNLLDSHDTERIRTLCKGDWSRERQAVLFQMTYPGTPCIYYGDEIGLEGGRDPDDRRTMPWDPSRWDRATLDFYRRILAVRKRHRVLRRGDYKTVSTRAVDGKGVFGFARTDGAARALVLFNRSEEPAQATVPISELGSKPLLDWLDNGQHFVRQGQWLQIDLPPHGIALLGTD